MSRPMKIPTARRLSSGSWFIQLRLGGESIPVTASSERECIRQAQYIKAEYQAGKRQKRNISPRKLPTLFQAIDTYIASRSNILSPATIRGYRIIQRNRFQPLMRRSLSDITPEDWISALNVEAGLCSPKTLTNAWRFLGSVMRETTGHSLPPATLPQVPPNERPFLDADQIKAFVAAAEGDPYQIPALLALSSLRRSEILGLKWENEALKRAQLPSGPVVTCHPEALIKEINRICDRAGVPRVGTHGLRHSFASLAYHLHAPEDYTMKIGGWADIQTMRKIYTPFLSHGCVLYWL